ncbi:MULTISPECIES: photosystem II reaction center PsbP [Planktothrix]|jgi:photosystem II oxygen-evolving enhancer protein 2|uniref:PsbP n=6 Tax=Planktothrix TaxID=54304 RepID=A0A073CPP3_PLAA1|nr:MULTISPECIES: photosystem II reaction center PsbP [Planktothrix]MCF3608083.1 photosystem II reaction center PsbP family protein [Planktothrix agardhii 1033]CAD5913976.1 PsbP-like protein 1, chloroplastic [Planktothrix rubescens]BBD54901.1 photosystem II oxygen-evolving complex protein PsbP [Planktothrix agardhii NIES-204]KEI65980.1 PsbP [Planktothrix agardhii NIVA-CYA 126/8]MBG0746360.1 photosystem II reaction center PsbP family protein [Planktothrix agardhii KL2]
MFKRILAIALVCFSLSLTGCISVGAGLNSFVDTGDGYEFIYPNGWTQVSVANGPDTVLHDMIEQGENVSVVINPVSNPNQTLAEIGTPTEVGYTLSKKAIAPEGSGRTAELINAESFEKGSNLYYWLEYAVQLPNEQKRHDFASVTISRGNLFTLNVSTTEKRWEKTQQLLKQVVQSFKVY